MPRLAAAAVVTLFASSALALPPLSSFDVVRLIEKLGSPSFPEREAAQKKLVGVGERALPPLRVAKFNKDPEVRRRAAKTIEAIEHQVWYDDTKRLIGAWKIVDVEEVGKPLLPEFYFGNLVFEWNRTSFSPAPGTVTRQLGALVERGRNGLSEVPVPPCRVEWEAVLATDSRRLRHYPRNSSLGTFMAGRAGALRTIDLEFRDPKCGMRTLRGIYEFDGESLRLCIELGTGKRPTSFETKGAPSATCFVLKPDTEYYKDYWERASRRMQKLREAINEAEKALAPVWDK